MFNQFFRHFFFLAVLLFLSAGVFADTPSVPDKPKLVRVTGHSSIRLIVMDNNDRTVQNVKVDSDGYFSFLIPPGRYHFYYSGKCFTAVDDDINELLVTYYLGPTAAFLATGIIKDIDGNPVPHCKIMLYRAQSVGYYTAAYVFTDKGGMYDYTDHPTMRTLPVVIPPENCEVSTTTYRWNYIITPSKKGTYSISGNVGMNGKAYEPYATPVSAGGKEVLTDNLGDFMIPGLSNGVYNVHVDRYGLDRVVTVNGHNVREVDFDMSLYDYEKGRAVIKGKVVDSNSKPLPGVKLTIDKNHNILTDEDGYYELTPQGGNYTITASLDAYTFEPESQGFSVIDKEVKVIDFIAVPKPILPPQAKDDNDYIVSVNETLNISAPGVLKNDENAVSAELQTGAQNGTVILNADGSFTYVPNNDFKGSDSFTYVAKNKNDEVSNIATVKISVGSKLVTVSGHYASMGSYLDLKKGYDRNDFSVFKRVRVDGYGYFSFKVTPGHYSFYHTQRSFDAVDDDINLGFICPDLRIGQYITGIVKDVDGNPVSHCKIMFYPLNGDNHYGFAVYTDKAGMYSTIAEPNPRDKIIPIPPENCEITPATEWNGFIVSPQKEGTYSIRGNVKFSGKPIVCLPVKVGDKATLTDDLGNYVITGLTDGEYTVVPDGAVPQTFTINGKNVSGVNFTIE